METPTLQDAQGPGILWLLYTQLFLILEKHLLFYQKNAKLLHHLKPVVNNSFLQVLQKDRPSRENGWRVPLGDFQPKSNA